MKRRGTSRRQVLDLDTKSSSPKNSWQTKYQQICLDHMNNTLGNSNVGDKNGMDVPEKKSLKLVGYGSDSETESETSKSQGDIDSKIEDFLKELSDTTPSECNNEDSALRDSEAPGTEKVRKHKVKFDIGPKQQNTVEESQLTDLQSNTQPTIAWLECYDENSGCYYYWHTETNEVTWEIPVELQAYRVALEQWTARQAVVGALVPKYASKTQPTVSIQQKNRKGTSNVVSTEGKTKHKRTKSKSDSEDERIELITSYGPKSEDEESDTEPEPAPTKKKKVERPKSKKKREQENESLAMGPQLPPGYITSETNQDVEPAPPGDEENYVKINKDQEEAKTRVETQTKLPDENSKDKCTHQPASNETKVSALQRLKELRNEDSDESDNSDSSEETKSNMDVEEDEVENSILEKLKKRAQILKELGGELPEEIKDLLEPEEEEEIKHKSDKFEDKEVFLSSTKSHVSIKDPIDEIVSSNNEIIVLKEKELMNQTKIKGDEKDIMSDEMKVANGLKIDSEKMSRIDSAVNSSKLEKPLIQEKIVSSISLIAGYGNEDDSETEDEKSNDKLSNSGKTTPLFPIVDTEKDSYSTKVPNLKAIKLSAKDEELMNSNTTTERARATEFNTTSQGLRSEASSVNENKPTPDISVKEDFIEPMKKNVRKKRIEIPVVIKPEPKPSLQLVDYKAESEEPVPSREGAYSNTWSYNSELRGGEHRGFGYGMLAEADKRVQAVKKGMIQFIKSETLMPKSKPVVSVGFQEKESPAESKESICPEFKDEAKDLAQVISEKVKFLSEGKETVPPVQVMAIQIETLMAALSGGGLSVKYLWEWLTNIDKQLASLEQAAAPRGFQCQWDRTYKRYFYRNEETGGIQWEYPADPVEEVQTQGGEEAMELCDSPPPPQPPPPPPPVSPPPPPPPPPRISSRSPSPELGVKVPPLPPMPPPPPPVISEQPPPPPLPPSPPPPPPPPVISAGEPLPPGVDMPDDMYPPPLPVAPPPPPVYSVGYVEPETTPVLHYEPYQSGEYLYPATASDYSASGESYMIARPPASNVPTPAPSLATELDCFYSEVAALDPPLPPDQPSPSPPPPPASSPPPPPPPPPEPSVEPPKKKKKTKLTPGLALKKKGVHSLVAKWQQVQQDVRREAKEDET